MDKIIVTTCTNTDGLYVEIGDIVAKDKILAVNFIGAWSTKEVSSIIKGLDIPGKYNISYINSKSLASILEYADNSIKAVKTCSG